MGEVEEDLYRRGVPRRTLAGRRVDRTLRILLAGGSFRVDLVVKPTAYGRREVRRVALINPRDGLPVAGVGMGTLRALLRVGLVDWKEGGFPRDYRLNRRGRALATERLVESAPPP